MYCNMEDKPQCCGFPASDQGITVKMAHRSHVEQPFPSPDGEVRAQKREILWPSLHSKQVAKPELDFRLFIKQFVVLGGGEQFHGPRHARQTLYRWATRTTQTQTRTKAQESHLRTETPYTETRSQLRGFCHGCGYQPDTPGKRALLRGIAAVRLACGQLCEVFPWLLVDVEGPRSLIPV